MPSVSETLSWAVVIPTYQREAVLLRCLHFVAQQTFPPKEIIVVDASPTWQDTHAKIQQNLAKIYPAIAWHHVQAQRLSSAAQRNQGIALASADILFLIDDDAFLYPDCAEEVMRVYARDTTHRVVGVMPALTALLPEVDLVKTRTLPSFSQKIKVLKAKLRQWAKQWIKDDDIFIPYDFSFYRYALPETLQGLAVHGIPMMHGARMTYRRDILTQVRFEETLARYAVNEDNDVCYRASRLGLLLAALKAKICHIQAREGRVSRFTATVLWGLNLAVLHRFHSADFMRFKRLFAKLLWRRLFTQTIKDLLDRRWTLPSTRGIWFILRHRQEIFIRTPEELKIWYPQFQQHLIHRDQPTP
jgi:GT2 family glycosyltransferase